MKHVVKLVAADMRDTSAWLQLLRQLDLSATTLLVAGVEITVDTVFFEPA